MKSYYNKTDINYKELITAKIFNKKPKIIVEFGILDGFSLKIFADLFPESKIYAFDIFEEFNGNSANKKDIENKFASYKNVKIQYGNFFEKFNELKDFSIDILHIDIANTGDIYEYTLKNYFWKIKENGCIILEGGSIERDNVNWMIKYKKSKINNVLEKWKKIPFINTATCGKDPSITFLEYNNEFNIHNLEKEDFEKGFFSVVNYFTKNLDPNSEKKALENIDLFQNKFVNTLVAEYKNNIIGTAKIYSEIKIHNNLKKVGHIEDFVIKEEFRKQYVGQLLLRKIIHMAKENNCFKIILDCSPDKSEFYQKNGFNKKGIEMTMYFNP